jgi:hypothetical protein
LRREEQQDFQQSVGQDANREDNVRELPIAESDEPLDHAGSIPQIKRFHLLHLGK